ncbi:MAG: hypothetical protein OXD46_00270 [Chloroflexi bacterium]|nr:hypothetical protein [Chloroflexota bacterium]
MKRGFLPVIAIALVYVGLLACGDDSTTTQPVAVETAPSVEPTAVPTAEPTAMPEPTATAIPTPEPTAEPTATPPPPPPATAVPEPASTVGSDMNLSEECLTGGGLDDASTILLCGREAIQQVESFAFEGDIDLLALFPVDGAGPGEGVITMSGTTVAPDKLRITVSLEAEGEKIEINAVMVGQDAYVQDPESGEWFKGVPPEADFLVSMQMVGYLQVPNDPNAALKETVELEDGTTGYAIVSDQSGPGSGMSSVGLPGGILTWIVGVDDFLTREARVSIEGLSDEPVDIMSMSYGGYNEEYEIEPPAEYSALPVDAMLSGPPGVAAVVGLMKNDDGDVEVMFDKPVQVQGTVELYVLEPTTGGWGLPLVGGSGTDTLIFDGDAEGKPTLVAGESQIAGFSFPDEESRLVDADGTGVNLNIDLWMYK